MNRSLWCEGHDQADTVLPDVLVHRFWIGAKHPHYVYVLCIDCANELHDRLVEADDSVISRLREYYWKRI